MKVILALAGIIVLAKIRWYLYYGKGRWIGVNAFEILKRYGTD